MADYYTQMTMQPEVPSDLLTEAEKDFLANFGIYGEELPHRKTVYLYAEQYNVDGWDEEEREVEEQELIDLCQALIKSSSGRLKFISMELAYTCSKMRPEAFGGSAYFITAEEFDFVSTSQWLMEKLGEVGE